MINKGTNKAICESDITHATMSPLGKARLHLHTWQADAWRLSYHRHQAFNDLMNYEVMNDAMTWSVPPPLGIVKELI